MIGKMCVLLFCFVFSEQDGAVGAFSPLDRSYVVLYDFSPGIWLWQHKRDELPLVATK